MKETVYKVIILILIISLITIVYIYNRNQSTKIEKKTTITALNTELNGPNHSVNTPKNNKITAYIPKNNLNTDLQSNIESLNKILEKTKEILKNHNKTSSNTIITNAQINELLSLNVPQDLQASSNSSNFDQNIDTDKNQDKELNISQNNGDSTYFKDNKTLYEPDSTLYESENTPEEPDNTSHDNSLDPKILTEIKQLKTEIDNVKQIIDKLNSNQL